MRRLDRAGRSWGAVNRSIFSLHHQQARLHDPKADVRFHKMGSKDT